MKAPLWLLKMLWPAAWRPRRVLFLLARIRRDQAEVDRLKDAEKEAERARSGGER